MRGITTKAVEVGFNMDVPSACGDVSSDHAEQD